MMRTYAFTIMQPLFFPSVTKNEAFGVGIVETIAQGTLMQGNESWSSYGMQREASNSCFLEE